MGILKAGDNSQLSPELDNLQAFSAHMYLKLGLEPMFTVKKNRTTESFDAEECYRLFRFRKDGLVRVKNALGIPNVVILNNKSIIYGD
jgi:hypothetical protein